MFSSFQNEGIFSPDFLESQEGEVFQRVSRQVEVVAHGGVVVVPGCRPVLGAPLPARPRGAHLADILRAVLAPAGTVMAGN